MRQRRSGPVRTRPGGGLSSLRLSRGGRERPAAAREHQQNRENLQPSDQHVERQHEPGGLAERLGEVRRRPGLAQRWAHVAECADNGPDRFEQPTVQSGEHDDAAQDQKEVDEEEAGHAADDVLGYGRSAVLHRHHCMGVLRATNRPQAVGQQYLHA